MNRLKQFLKNLISLVDFFAYSDINYKKRVLILRLDAIGDYVLFRNFLEEVKKEYIDYEITLVGNKVWKNLSETFDKSWVDRFFWVDVKKFEKNIFYRLKVLKSINRGYEIIINPTYSRSFSKDDAIVRVIKAKEKIGFNGDFLKESRFFKKISDKYYTKLIPSKKEVIFEFLRNKEFFEKFLNKELNIEKPSFDLQNKINLNLPSNYVVLFIGGSESFRKWKIENFVKVGEFLKKEYGYNIVVCGGPSDIEDAKKFKKLANYKYTDLVGETSLVEFLYVLKDAKILISNETSAPHFAVALDVENIFVISNGNHFGRFTPYPKEIYKRYFAIYPESFDEKSFEELVNLYGHGSNLDINQISFERVKKKIKELL